MSRPSDWQQREQSRDLRNSCIVQAPAGSGKTELLTQRLLALLAQVESPEEVVAITFTRKAAAEMSRRLLGHLQAANKKGTNTGEKLEPHELISHQLALKVLENDSRQGWNLLEQPSRLRIRTIDSLCSELARQLPVLSGLGGGQQVAKDASALYRKAAARTMATIEDDNDELRTDVIRVLDRYNNQYDTLVELLTGMLASREQWIGHLLASRTDDGFDRHGLEQALRYLVEFQLKKARQIIPGDLLTSLPQFYRYALSNDPDNEAALTELLAACGGPDCDFLDLPKIAEALVHWQTVIDTLFTKADEMRKAAPGAKDGFPPPSAARGEEKDHRKAWKDDFKEILDTHRGNDQLREIFTTVRSLPNPDYENEAWESLKSLMRILLQAAKNLTLVMAETGEVDFSEIAYRAIESLGFEDAPSELALRMDYRIQHLLVDEFQDTSFSQVKLLNQLTAGWVDGDGRTLFLVGDPMQSIYRFRKAEVSLFIEAWQGRLFEHIRLVPLQLMVNFRSTRPIVEWINQVFPVVMPRENDGLMGAVSYTRAGTKPDVSGNGNVTIKILPGRDDEEEARQVIDIIGCRDPEQSMAVLVRSRTHASAILAKLDRLKRDRDRYRYQAINFTPLADTTLIKDLVSLTLALIQPADRLAWLATLRAPHIGLDLADLETLVAADAGGIILDAFSKNNQIDAPKALSHDGQQRLQRTAAVLLHATNRRGRQSIRSLVESTWISLGGPACVDNTSELDDALTFFDMLETMEDEDLPIDRDTLDGRMKNLFAEPDASANKKLQVLTIYAAKGLQFDTVILPGLNRPPRGDSNKLIHWFELAGEKRIVMSPMRNIAEKEKQKKSGDLIKFITDIEKKRRQLEDGRLLYVAATRAIQNLYLFGAIKPTASNEIKANANSLLGGLWPAIHQDQVPLISVAIEDSQQQVLVGDDDEAATSGPCLPQIYRRLAADWHPPDPPVSIQAAKAEPVEASDYIEFNWAGEDARLTGNLVHRLLQVIGDQGLENWTDSGGVSRQADWCRHHLASKGVQAEKADAIIARATRAIENCLASEQGRWILGNHEGARCEYGITTVVGSQPRNLVLDRTFVADDTRWIIDYKTSSHGGGDLDGFLRNEAERYREQLSRYKNAIAITETRPIKTALYFPMLDQLLEVS